MKTNNNSQDVAIKQEMMGAMPLTMRVLYWLGCFKDKGLKWKRCKDGQMKLRHWRLTPIWYNPFLLAWMVIYYTIFGIVNIVRNIFESVTGDITISPVD